MSQASREAQAKVKSTTHAASIRKGAHLAALTKQPQLEGWLGHHYSQHVPTCQPTCYQKIYSVSLKRTPNIL